MTRSKTHRITSHLWCPAGCGKTLEAHSYGWSYRDDIKTRGKAKYVCRLCAMEIVGRDNLKDAVATPEQIEYSRKVRCME